MNASYPTSKLKTRDQPGDIMSRRDDMAMTAMQLPPSALLPCPIYRKTRKFKPPVGYEQ